MKHIHFIFILFLILTGCEPAVVFKDAMPPGVDPVTTVPKIFRGVYVSENDSARIYIEKDLAVQESFYEFVTSVARVHETEDCSIVAGGLYLPGRKECIPFEYINEDSITAKVYELDTIFSFDKDEVAKYYKGHLFLNLKSDSNNWICWMLTPQQDGSITLELIDIPDNKRKIEEISIDYETRNKDKKDVQYIINPTLVEFDKILEKEYTRKYDVLRPVNLENSVFKKLY